MVATAYDIGIDVGSVSVKCVAIDQAGSIAFESPSTRHFGLFEEETRRLLEQVRGTLPPGRIRSISFTGLHGRLLSEILGAPFEVDTIAQVLGAVHVVPGVRTVMVIGGQSAALFQLSHDNGRWHLDHFAVNGPCASGTGSFIDQQAERLATSLYGPDFDWDQERLQKTLEDFIALGLTSADPAPVACRCTVFTKSDMIHLQNKGTKLADIVAGLHYGNAANYVSTIVGNRTLAEPIVFAGGVASNAMQVRALQRYFPGLRVPPYHASLGAIGVALRARQMGWDRPLEPAAFSCAAARPRTEFPRAEPLRLVETRFDPDNSLPPWRAAGHARQDVYLGIDVGSTTTKHALISADGTIIHKCYLPTQGKPIEVAGTLLRRLSDEVGTGIRLLGIATTGSGRSVVGEFLGADLVIDEITAHARGAVEVDPDVDTIFEIGGQDSKYVRVEATHPLAFDMNKVCAAGTGSFLQELASKLRVNIAGQFQDLALAAREPVRLADRCTVFMESELVGYLQKGAGVDDLIAGLCYAVVHNYLNRVVGKHRVGRRIMFLGGPSLNRGVVAAFERVLARPLVVPRHREVLGAFGAALALREACRNGRAAGRERDLAAIASTQIAFNETVCRADRSCHNECKLKVYDFGGRKGIWGGDCGRYESRERRGPAEPDLFEERRRLFRDALEQKALQPDGDRPRNPNAAAKTVGVPLSLHSLEWGVFWTHVLSDLGLTVILSPPTDNRIALAGVEQVTAEACFPVKIFHGHVSCLLDCADLVFLPTVIDMPAPLAHERGFFCPFIQASQFVAKAGLRIPEERLIRPSLHLREGPDGAVEPFLRSLPEGLRPGRRALRAILGRSWEKQARFRRMLEERGEAFLRETPDDRPVWVVTGRPYNLHDERCNLRLGKHLSRLGVRALPMDFLRLDGESLDDFPRMYWGLGSRILRAAKRIARTPNLYGLHLSNFSCGPDSFIEHFYCHLLREKPPLILELDEHTASVGLLTRLEAYQNVVRNLSLGDRPGIGEPARERRSA